MLSKFYLGSGILMLLLYAAVAFTGREFGDEKRQFVPAEARNAPGGYRNFHYWHGGYRGGK